MRVAVFFLLTLPFVAASSVSAVDDEPIQALLASLSRYRHIRVESSSRVLTRSDKLIKEGKSDVKSESIHGKLAVKCCRQEDRTLLYWSREVSHADDVRRYGMEYLLQNGKLLYIQSRLGSAFEQESADSLVATYAAEDLAGPEQRKSVREVMEGLGDSALALGYLGYYPLSEYLGAGASIATKTVEKKVNSQGDESSAVEITAESSLGNLQLRLEPAFDFLPSSILLEKTGGHPTSGNRTIQEIEMNGSEEIWPDGKVTRIVWSVEDIELATSPTGCYIKEAKIIQAVHSEAGPTIETITDMEIQECVYSPKFTERDFETNLKIPVGFPVTAEGAEHLPFEWDGAAVVPAVTSNIPSFPKPAKNTKWQFLVIINVLLFVLIAAFFFWKRHSRKS